MSEPAFLDAKGMKCPLPVLKARRLLKEMQPGEQIEIEATDPGADKDFAHFCAATGHQMVEASRDGEVLRFLIRKQG